MKKIIYAIISILFVMSLTLVVVHADSIPSEEKSIQIKLPASIQFVDDDAFEGTALFSLQQIEHDQEETTSSYEESKADQKQQLKAVQGADKAQKSEKKLSKESSILSQSRNWSVFLLPNALLTIEDEAFEGTGVVSVRLPDSLLYLGDRAFANTNNLRNIYIPENLHIIGNDLLAGTRRVTITGTANGQARTWAQEQGLPFIPVATVKAEYSGTQLNIHTSGKRSEEQIDSDVQTEGLITDQPTRNTVGNINASRYENGIAYHVQGRSPPTRL